MYKKRKHTCSRVLTRGTCHLSTQHTMAVPTYDELLAHYDVEKSIMKQTFDDEHLRDFSLMLDTLETLSRFLGIPNSDITGIKNQGSMCNRATDENAGMLEAKMWTHGNVRSNGKSTAENQQD